MANKQIEMRKVKKIFNLYAAGISKRMISKQTGISRNTVTKYIAFFERYKLTIEEVSKLSLEELHGLFLSKEKPKSKQLQELETFFP
jgi:transposase